MLVAATITMGLAVAAFATLVMLMRLRRRFVGRREEPSPDFDLADLHRLRDTGQLTDDELARATASVLARRAARADTKRVAGEQRGFDVLPPARDDDRSDR
jgi:hypothetical protein